MRAIGASAGRDRPAEAIGDVVLLFGSREYVDQLGYVIERCPSCRTTGVFAVYHASRKLTVYLVPTVPVGGQQQIVECKTCQERFVVPEEARAGLAKRVMTQEELSARIREMRSRPPQPEPAIASGTHRRTYYQILQVDRDAEPEVIDAAFKRLALKYHPDRSTAPEAAARMRELIEAKEHLSDPRKRRAYDASLGIVRRTEALRPEEV